MSYLVLARKYRPQNFDEVYAQDQITQILKNSIDMNRIAHAYLFNGPRGVGKTSLARIFSKSLNCLDPDKSKHPCNVCENCVQITNGTSADVIEIDGASNTGVEDIRDLQKELLYAASNSRYKIYIIDEVHMLSKNAFNALLKTLEEPPDNVIFIFATTEPQKVLPTIISRCQRYDFKRIPIIKIVARLKDISQAENIKITEEAMFLIAKMADGSMRDSQSLLDQVLAYGREDITLNDVMEIFGTVHTEIYENITRAISNQEPAAIISQLHQILERGTDLQEMLGGYLEYIRNITLFRIGVTPQEVAPNQIEAMKEVSQLFSENELVYLITLLMQVKVDIKSSNTPVLVAEMAFIKLSRLAEMKTIEDIVGNLGNSNINQQPTRNSHRQTSPPVSQMDKVKEKQIIHEKQLHQKLSEEKQRVEKESEQAKEMFKELDLELIKKYMPHIAEDLKRDKSFVGVELAKAEIIDFKNNRITIVKQKRLAHSILTKNLDWIEEKLSNYFGRKLHLTIKLDEPKKSDAILNPNIMQIEEKDQDLAKKLRKLKAYSQITSRIENEY